MNLKMYCVRCAKICTCIHILDRFNCVKLSDKSTATCVKSLWLVFIKCQPKDSAIRLVICVKFSTWKKPTYCNVFTVLLSLFAEFSVQVNKNMGKGNTQHNNISMLGKNNLMISQM